MDVTHNLERWVGRHCEAAEKAAGVVFEECMLGPNMSLVDRSFAHLDEIESEFMKEYRSRVRVK